MDIDAARQETGITYSWLQRLEQARAVLAGGSRGAFSDSEVRLLENLVADAAAAWDRLQQGGGPARRDAILAAAQFAGQQFLRGRAWEQTMPEVLARVGRATDVSRVYYFENHRGPDGELLTSQRNEWVADGIEPQIENPELQGLSCHSGSFARWAACLDRGDSICGLVREMPDAERDVLESQGIISVAVMPIRVAGRWSGFLGFDECRGDRQWHQAELDALQVVTDMLGAALERKLLEVDREREQELRIRSHKLEALGTLAGGVAHDFNNLLSAMSGNAELAQTDLPPDHPVQENLGEIAKACSRATALVRRILAFSRPHDPNREAVQMQDVVEEALKLLRPTLPAMLELRTAYAPHLPAVLADSTQIHQVVVNLATNSAHAIGLRSGWIEFRLDATMVHQDRVGNPQGLRPGPYVRLSVSDDGAGMDRATLDRIFDPFFTTKRPGQGTGLGLSVVHGIVKTHEGGIAVESRPGQGSVFHLLFPAIESAASQPATERRKAALRRGIRVLYVDDESALVFLANRMLTRLGHHVTGCTDAAQALVEFCSQPGNFDVVVTDVSMPGLSGFDLARELLAVRPDVPIVMTSGYLRPEDHEAARQLGIRDLVLKPSTVNELNEILDRLLSQLAD
jgi:signal transduction histidine kinase/ActR/RegA family two-component response regulator